MQTANQLKSLSELLNLVKYEDFATVFYASVKNSSIFTVLQKSILGIDADGREWIPPASMESMSHTRSENYMQAPEWNWGNSSPNSSFYR